MITQLAPLGAKYKLQLIPEYTGDTVTVSVIFSLKSDDEPVIKTLSFSGTPAEVDVALAEQLPIAVAKLAAHATSMEELDAQLAKEAVDRKEAAANSMPKKTTAATPAAKPASVAAKGKSKSITSVATPTVKTEAPAPLPTPSPGALTPAWKKPIPDVSVAPEAPAEPVDATPEEPDDLGKLFAEEGEETSTSK